VRAVFASVFHRAKCKNLAALGVFRFLEIGRLETTCRKFLAGNAFGGFCNLRAPLETRFIGAKFVNPEIRAHFERRRAFGGADVQFRFSKSRAAHRAQR